MAAKLTPQRATAPIGAAAECVPMQGHDSGSQTQQPQLVNPPPERSEVKARSAGAPRHLSTRQAILALAALSLVGPLPAPLVSPPLGSGRGHAGKQRARDGTT
jgi:hypothetical protein